jgi:hypothetical protein
MALALSPRIKSGMTMIRRALLLLALAGIYVGIKRKLQNDAQPVEDQAAAAQWANEGGANAPSSV